MGVALADSALGALVATIPDGEPTSFVMRSGHVDLLLLVGITAEEYAWSLEHGTDPLVAALRTAGLTTSDPARATMLPMRGTALPPHLAKHFG
jgi:hypothetical protein